VFTLFGLTSESPRQEATSLEQSWRTSIAEGARADPGTDFQNPPQAIFIDRLNEAAREYGFSVVRVEILHPLEDAPMVIVQSSDPVGLARATPAILRRLDRKEPAVGQDEREWVYEGFFFEAQDSSGEPFLVTYNSWRGSSVGGGQWARSDDLYPFKHG
jgi:hypothetical protein